MDSIYNINPMKRNAKAIWAKWILKTFLGSSGFNFFLSVVKYNVHFIFQSDDINLDGLTTRMLHCVAYKIRGIY